VRVSVPPSFYIFVRMSLERPTRGRSPVDIPRDFYLHNQCSQRDIVPSKRAFAFSPRSFLSSFHSKTFKLSLFDVLRFSPPPRGYFEGATPEYDFLYPVVAPPRFKKPPLVGRPANFLKINLTDLPTPGG
jgi:hypothetical protein